MKSNSTPKKKTYIDQLVRESGRFKKWFAVNLGYKVNNSTSSFNYVVQGRRIPSAKNRLKLANILGVKVTDLWYLDDETGQVKPRMVWEKRKQNVGSSS